MIPCFLCCIMVKCEIQFQRNMLSHFQKKQRSQRPQHNSKEASFLMGSKGNSKSISPINDGLPIKMGHKLKFKEDSLEKGAHYKKSFKVVTTDESSNNQESNCQESLEFYSNKQLNEEYFQPLSFKQKKLKTLTRKKEPQSKLLQDISIKITEMSRMVCQQDKEINTLKSSMSDKELHRLLKMHSVEKLKLLSEIPPVSHSKSRKRL